MCLRRISIFLFLFLFWLAFGPFLKAQELIKEKKSPKISYKWYQGRALMKTGLILRGKFKYSQPEGEVPYFSFEDDEEIQGKKKIEVPLFKELMLSGSEYGVTAYQDSTKFEWLEGFDNLFRILRNGKIKLMDNSRIIAEKYDYLEDYRIVSTSDGKNAVQLKTVKDLEPLMKDRPYFMDAARATGKYNSRESRVFIYLTDLYNDPAPLKILQWKDLTITKINGEKMSGSGYIQPVDLRGEYGTDNKAYVHLHDGKDFHLYRDDEISRLVWNGNEMQKGYFGISDKNFFGIPWSYGGVNYILIKKIYNPNNFFYFHKLQDGEDMEVLKEISGTYIKPNNASLLKLNYIQENGAF